MLRRIVEEVRDQGVSFVAGAIPAFLGTAFLGGMFSLGMGLGAAAGLPGGLTVLTGMLLAGVTLGVSAGVGIVLGAGGLLGAAAVIDNIPFLRDAKIKGLGMTAGIVSGIAASVMMAFNLASEPESPAVEPARAAFHQMEDAGVAKTSVHTVFSDAGKGVLASVANEAAVPAPAAPVPALRLAA